MKGNRVAWLCGPSLLLGSFLLFQIELILGKYFLPQFGSVSSVWVTCLMCYQVLLLIGYVYAWGLSYLPVRGQCFTHFSCLLALACLFLGRLHSWPTPITPALTLESSTSPAVTIVLLLLSAAGLPFVLLAGNGVLAQSWAGQIGADANPYRYYALSNAGSLLALVSYPFLVEPLITVSRQAKIWVIGAGIFLGISIAMAIVTWRRFGSRKEMRVGMAECSASADHKRESYYDWLLVFFLAACAALLLAASTNQVCQDVSPVPLLWIAALTAYLASFVVAFSGRLHWNSSQGVIAGLAGVALAWCALHYEPRLGLLSQVLLHAGGLFLVGVFCHHEAYRLRPDKGCLPVFYLILAFGGTLGGVFVAAIAPLWFKDFYEYHLGLLLVLLLAAVVARRASSKAIARVWTSLPSGIALILAVFVIADLRKNRAGIVESTRNFYGVLRIHRQTKGSGSEAVTVHSLLHGKITHGMQADRTRYRYRATTYFTESSGVGMVIARFRELNPDMPVRMGLMGLGIGTMAAYGKKGDYLRFYEINPAVIRYATDGRFFSYLADCQARIEIAEGDARLTLRDERESGMRCEFDIIVLDVFSGGAIPAHLLTREAFELYLEHLASDGVIAWHATNRYLDFAPLAMALARTFGLSMALVDSEGDFKISTPARWIILARNPGFLDAEPLKSHLVLAAGKVVRMWTDDYSNIVALLKHPSS
ncbi:MAG: spermidine synthase [Kiritimatiellia bacterium]